MLATAVLKAPNISTQFLPLTINTLTWQCVWRDLKVTSTSKLLWTRGFITATRTPMRSQAHIYEDRFSKRDTFLLQWPEREMSKFHFHDFVCVMNAPVLSLSWLLTRVLLCGLEIHIWSCVWDSISLVYYYTPVQWCQSNTPYTDIL